MLSQAVWPTRKPTQNRTTPKSAPFTVKLDDPVNATFAGCKINASDGMSSDNSPETVPKKAPKVTDKRRDRIAPPVDLTDAAVSDIHVVPSHTVPPTDRASECRARPALLPINVTLTDPVAAKLDLLAELATGPSAEIATVTVPTCPPTLADTRILVCTMLLALHTIDVSTTHIVTSQTVQPSRTPELMLNKPYPAPCIVIRTDPVPAAFAPLVTLIACAATDTPLVSVPDLPPAVITVRPLLSLVVSDALHAIAVSDSHVERSHAVSIPRALALDAKSPRPAPCTVTLADPDAATLLARTLLPTATAKDNAPLTLPARIPVVTASRWLPTPPWPSRPRNPVSDTHSLAAQLLIPDLATAL